MKHALIIGHPNPKSFTHSVAAAYADAVRRLGHEVLVRDLYAMGFNPCLGQAEVPTPQGYEPGEDVKAERALIASVNVFAYFYPLWFNAPPAIVKGYADRVFGMGFGYSPFQHGGNQPLLTGRKMVCFSSSGAPKQWLVKEGAWAALRNLFDQHLAEVCGFTLLDHVHLGGVYPGMSEHLVTEHFRTVRGAVDRLLGKPGQGDLSDGEDRTGIRLA
jgi:NAD(P)H dehydrogenase (quinone)